MLRVAKRIYREAKAGSEGSEEAREQDNLDHRVKKRFQTASTACVLLVREPGDPRMPDMEEE